MWIAFVVIPVTLMWAFCVVDVFFRRDLSGWGKTGWLLTVFVLPLFGALIYLIARPEASERVVDSGRVDTTIGDATASVADEVAKLDRLRNEGVISDTDFAREKARLFGVPAQRAASTGAAAADQRAAR